jgi:hypothetical protein
MHQEPNSKIITMGNPYIICFQRMEGGVEVHVHMQEGWDYSVWGIIVADIIKNVADAMEVDPRVVCDVVMMEIANPTDEVVHPHSEEEAQARWDEVYVKQNWTFLGFGGFPGFGETRTGSLAERAADWFLMKNNTNSRTEVRAVYYAYGRGCEGWIDKRRPKLAARLREFVWELPVDQEGTHAYVDEKPGLVRIRKLTHYSAEQYRAIVKVADRIYDEVMEIREFAPKPKRRRKKT